MDADSVSRALLQFAALGLPFAVAIALPVIGFLLVVGLQRSHTIIQPSVRLAAIVILMILGSSLSIALSGRSLLTAEDLVANPFLFSTISPSPYGRLASQISTILILLVASTEIFSWFVRRWRTPQAATTVLTAGSTLLILSLLLYFFLSVVVSGIFGAFRDPRLNDLYLPFLALALTVLAKAVTVSFWRALRVALAVFSVASLIAAVLVSDLAVAQNFRQTVIPGISFRLYGIADHANALGFVAGTALLLEFSTHVRQRPNSVLAMLHSVVLVFSQSKTAWIAFLVGLTIVRYQWLQNDLFRGDRFKVGIVAALFGIFAAIIIVLSIFFIASADGVISYLRGIGIFTFTGRTAVWGVAWDEFLKSPLTGYGPSIWDLQFRNERGLAFAGQAHNQFMHVLGQAGLLGLVGMLLHLAVLLYFAFSRRHLDRGLALALVLMLLVRCLSESPLRMGGIMGWDAFIHLSAFIAVGGLTVTSRRLNSTGSLGAKNLRSQFA